MNLPKTKPELDLSINDYGWSSSEKSSSNDYVWSRLKNLLPTKKAKILDLGCGNGYLAGKMSQLGHQVIGVDSSELGIELAQKTYPNIHFLCDSAYSPLKPLLGEVDIVVCSEVIEHLTQPNLLIKNIHSVLKDGGMLILTTPYHGYLKNLALSLFNKWDNHFSVGWEHGHIKFFSEKSILTMLNKNAFQNHSFHHAGRMYGFWKSLVCRSYKSGKITRFK